MIPEKTKKSLVWITGILNSKKIQYQVSGGLAAKIYGSQRQLNDVDIEIPEDRFNDIMEELKPFITDELKQHKNGKWDSLCMSLNYEGQEIDISGAYTCKVSNKERTDLDGDHQLEDIEAVKKYIAKK